MRTSMSVGTGAAQVLQLTSRHAPTSIGLALVEDRRSSTSNKREVWNDNREPMEVAFALEAIREEHVTMQQYFRRRLLSTCELADPKHFVNAVVMPPQTTSVVDFI
jgi:hypothetical protein